jgi:hypothetical protein
MTEQKEKNTCEDIHLIGRQTKLSQMDPPADQIAGTRYMGTKTREYGGERGS